MIQIIYFIYFEHGFILNYGQSMQFDDFFLISWTRLEIAEFTDALEICVDVIVSVGKKRRDNF